MPHGVGSASKTQGLMLEEVHLLIQVTESAHDQVVKAPTLKGLSDSLAYFVYLRKYMGGFSFLLNEYTPKTTNRQGSCALVQD